MERRSRRPGARPEARRHAHESIERPAANVGAVDRALLIVEWLADQADDQPSVRSIAAATGLTKTTVHRLLETLARRGWVAPVGEESYRLAGRALRVGAAAIRQMDFVAKIRPFAARLRDQTEETVFTTTLDERDLVIVDKFESPSPIRFHGQVGSRSPAHANAAGKALLARAREPVRRAYLAGPLAAITAWTLTDPVALLDHLALVRERGVAVSDQEAVVGAASIGAAVLDYAGEPIAGLSVSGPRERILARADDLRAAVAAAADAASAALGAPASALTAGHSDPREPAG